jgi:hypothetical protein
MSRMPELRPIITALKGSTGSGTIIRRRVDPASTVDVYLGIEPGTGQIGVLLRLHRRLVPAERDRPGGSGFSIQIHAIPEDVRNIVNLGIFCTDPACEDVFLHFMDDLVSHLLVENGPEAALRAFLTRVALWQRFFVQGQSGHLSEEAQVGLFGELLVLRDIIIPSVGAAAGVDSWKGPEGKPQDYLLSGGALEVKCTRAKAGTRIAIANEMQLDERPFAFLTLIHIAVTLAGAGHPSLPELVSELRTTLVGLALLAFDDRLINAGYLDAHEIHYRECRFFLREVSFFDVRDDFPRVRPGDCPVGVVDIAYRIDPMCLAPFRIEKDAVEARLKT